MEISDKGTRVSVWTNAMVRRAIRQDTGIDGRFGAAPVTNLLATLFVFTILLCRFSISNTNISYTTNKLLCFMCSLNLNLLAMDHNIELKKNRPRQITQMWRKRAGTHQMEARMILKKKQMVLKKERSPREGASFF
jgi:hypothetical protein